VSSAAAIHSVLTDDDIGALPPEMTGGLTFHLPMELVALRDAGASDTECAVLRNERLREAWAVGLIDPPMYRWAVERYRETAAELLSNDHSTATRALHDIEPLAEGLAGAAFHGLIRLGYGLWQRNTDEVARGLAYLRTRRQVLGSPPAASPGGTAGTAGTAATAEPAGQATSHATGHATAQTLSDLPSEAEQAGVTVFDLLNIAAGSSNGNVAHESDTGSPASQRRLVTHAVALVHRNPQSFVAVHALTGVHALCELQQIAGDHVLKTWWEAYAVAQRACSILVQTTAPDTPVAYDSRYGPIRNVGELVVASIQSGETHDVKLAVALRRLMSFGLLTEAEAVQTGTTRIASGQLAVG
jgi:hypothetical protein